MFSAKVDRRHDRLRVAHVSATFPPYRGGTGNVCWHHARVLAARGHDVQVFTAVVPGALAQETRDGVVINRLRPLVRVGNAPVLPQLFTALHGFDVVHLHYPFILGAELTACASLLQRRPFILSFHNDLIGEGGRAKLFATYQHYSAKTTVRMAERLCAVSLDHYRSSNLQRTLTTGAPPIVELPNGVDTSIFCPTERTGEVRRRYGIPHQAPLALFVAALDRAHHFKGCSTLLQAVQILAPEVYLLVVGDGDIRRVYQQQAQALGVAGRVVFAGAIDHDHTPAFFRDADVTVLPSIPPESFGLVLIESLACGTPVIASNIPGVRTVVDHGNDGLLVEPNDPAGLAAAITQIVADEPQRRAMGACGRAKVVARYDWQGIGVQLEQIYQDVVAAPASPSWQVEQGR